MTKPMLRKRKRLAPETSVPAVSSEILDQTVGKRQLSIEELDAAQSRKDL